MKITFPRMGNSYIAIKALFESLDYEVVVPPPCSKRTLELGVRYAPESMCLPMKIGIGNYIEAMQKGADTIIMFGGWGPCRFGYYGQLENDILKQLGYDFEMIVLEIPDDGMEKLWEQIRSLKRNVSWLGLWSALRFAWEKLKAVDDIEKLSAYYLPRTPDKQKAIRLFHRALKKIDNCVRKDEVKTALQEITDEFSRLPLSEEEPIKIGLVGEIYTILEPFANYHIERQLGELNVEVCRELYFSRWVNEHILGGILRLEKCERWLPYSEPYLNHWVGGHGRESVACAVKYARDGLDGVIQIGPLTCMPEIVAHSVMSKVSAEENIPIMSLYFDEHGSEAGIVTRLEAFIDMIGRRKKVLLEV